MGCRHGFTWTSNSTSLEPPEWTSSMCGQCGTWATWQDHRWVVGQESLGSRAMSALAARDDALTEVLAVLGTGECRQNKCDGCSWEMQEAVHIVKRALGLEADATEDK
jgi:hypothetical protein